ncbi:hypothetical protein ACM26T_08155, partial [Kluyvera sichuanensis]|uniref:hypothetical protein n=1 Tax=Kluyvera sichuanensis TaxID=2725494 RepID=UPI0039F64A26
FDVFAGKKSAQIREILISESAWEEMTCLFAPSLALKAGRLVSRRALLRGHEGLLPSAPVLLPTKKYKR